MDYSKTRCPICLKRFCCVQHKNAHLKKEHPQYLKKSSQETLLKSFQKKAQQIILNAQKYSAHNRKIANQPIQNPVNSNASRSKNAFKRCHSELNQQIVSTSIIITSEVRKILIPVHKSKGKTFENPAIKPKSKIFVEARKSSPCDTCHTIVKTSTPIIKNQLVQSTPQDSWNISQTSSISNYQTPSYEYNSDQRATVYETPLNSEIEYKPGVPTSLKTHIYQTKRTLTSPRSIMTKISKYSNELDPNSNLNIAKCRRVTFSFESINSSPLESLKEVEIGKDGKDEYSIGSNGELRNDVETRKLSEDCNKENNKLREEFYSEETARSMELYTDSSPSEKTKSGFFNCVTNMICSAVPIFASWRGLRNDSGSRSKRSRSPDKKCIGVEVIRSPELKRLCYPYDLRYNPIKARKSISEK